jgi:sulfate adenylyltransferase subunit 1 (EFTu-like GTPase family)
MDGRFTRDSQVRVLRDNVVVHTGKIGSLRRFKDDVSEVRSGMECGITLENFNDVKQGDVIEAFVHRRHYLRAAARRFAFAQGQAARGAQPEGPAARQVQRGRVAEIDSQDLWQRAALAAVTVSSATTSTPRKGAALGGRRSRARLLGGVAGRRDRGVVGMRRSTDRASP